MPRNVKGALLQASWTGDKESMIQKHEKYAHEAAKQGAQVMLFQELFYGPYFCQVQDPQYYSYTEKIPDGPTTKRMQDLAKQTGMVLVVPMYEEDEKASGIYYNTAAVIDADGTYLGKYRKTHIPHVKGFWEKFYFRPGNLGYPVFDTAVGKVGVYICYDRHFPEGARALGLNGAEVVLIPSATSRGLSEYLWRVEQVSHAVANGYYVGTINRVGKEPLGDDDFYGQSYFVDPRGQFVGGVGSPYDEELIILLTLMAEATDRLRLGTCVTNPGTREPTVTASALAVLDELSGGRMDLGIGRGDSARRVLGKPPITLAHTEEAIRVIRALVGGERIAYEGTDLYFPWTGGWQLPVWVAGYGPMALAMTGRVADGVILQLADPDLIRWFVGQVRDAAAAAGRDPDSIRVQAAAPAHVGSRELCRERARWFPALVSNHVVDLV